VSEEFNLDSTAIEKVWSIFFPFSIFLLSEALFIYPVYKAFDAIDSFIIIHARS